MYLDALPPNFTRAGLRGLGACTQQRSMIVDNAQACADAGGTLRTQVTGDAAWGTRVVTLWCTIPARCSPDTITGQPNNVSINNVVTSSNTNTNTNANVSTNTNVVSPTITAVNQANINPSINPQIAIQLQNQQQAAADRQAQIDANARANAAAAEAANAAYYRQQQEQADAERSARQRAQQATPAPVFSMNEARQIATQPVGEAAVFTPSPITVNTPSPAPAVRQAAPDNSALIAQQAAYQQAQISLYNQAVAQQEQQARDYQQALDRQQAAYDQQTRQRDAMTVRAPAAPAQTLQPQAATAAPAPVFISAPGTPQAAPQDDTILMIALGALALIVVARR